MTLLVFNYHLPTIMYVNGDVDTSGTIWLIVKLIIETSSYSIYNLSFSYDFTSQLINKFPYALASSML